MTTRTVQILGLRCLQAQEIDGDEIYLTAGEHTLWSVGVLRMQAHPADDASVNEVDFVEGRARGRAGWAPLAEFDAATYRVPVGEGLLIQIKERDLLLGDDTLGQAEIVPGDGQRGEIQLAFQNEGAHYVLRYRVDDEAGA